MLRSFRALVAGLSWIMLCVCTILQFLRVLVNILKTSVTHKLIYIYIVNIDILSTIFGSNRNTLHFELYNIYYPAVHQVYKHGFTRIIQNTKLYRFLVY